MVTIITAVLFLSLMVQPCQSETPKRISGDFYLAENRALLNHVFQWKTVSTAVICGRDCSMDPQCASFNYHTSKHVCKLNNASRAHSSGDFIEIQGSAYYDNNFDTSSYSIPLILSNNSCLELYQAGYHSNGLYTIFPTSMPDGLRVYCDMETDGGGWIVFQRRQDGSVDFDRTWAEYQSGFGDLQNEFWLGNDILRDLTASGQWQLRVDLEDWQSNTAWASYVEFAVTGDNYTLHVVSDPGEWYDAGDSMSNHNGRPFSTKDQDNDQAASNCADSYNGAWWFDTCTFVSHLNNEYYEKKTVPAFKGIQWITWNGRNQCMKKCSMKIRQVL